MYTHKCTRQTSLCTHKFHFTSSCLRFQNLGQQLHDVAVPLLYCMFERGLRGYVGDKRAEENGGENSNGRLEVSSTEQKGAVAGKL